MPATFRNGKYGAIKFAGVEYPFRVWVLDPQANDQDTSSFDSDQDADGVVYGDCDVGIVRTTIEFRGHYPVGFNLWGGGIKLKPGLQVVMFLGITPLIGATVTAKILSARIETDVDQPIGFQGRAKTTGAITWPGD